MGVIAVPAVVGRVDAILPVAAYLVLRAFVAAGQHGKDRHHLQYRHRQIQTNVVAEALSALQARNERKYMLNM